MNELTIINDIDVSLATSDSAVIVILDDETEIIQTLEQGPPGPPGPPGPDGVQGYPGNTILYGPVDPVPQQGVDGNFYINTATYFIFGPKANGAWPAGVDMVGATILSGPADPAAGVGVNGDFYINTATHMFFGPKTAGAWPPGTSMVGPEGPQGPQGEQGAEGPQGPQGPQGIPGTGGGGGGSSVYVSDTPPVDAPDNSLWWELDSGLLYVRYRDADSAAWVIAVPKSDTSSLLSINAQTLTPAQQTQTRKNIYAAPLDAMAYSGMQINGGFDISQELAGNGRSTTGHVCDGWLFSTQGGAIMAQQSFSPGIFPGLPSWVYLAVGTAVPSLAIGDHAILSQRIEGNRTARLEWGTVGAKPITIGFWSRHARPGIYSVAIRNNALDRVYATTYTHDVSNANEYKTVTIPGDTTGTWDVQNAIGLQIIFAMAASAANIAPAANVWSAGYFLAAPGQVNGIAATTDVFRIAGVVVLPGIEAPTAERSPLIMRPAGQELLMCQRYFQQQVSAMVSGYSVAGGAIYSVTALSPMRAAPATVFSAVTYSNAYSLGVSTATSTILRAVCAITATGNGYALYSVNLDARL